MAEEKEKIKEWRVFGEDNYFTERECELLSIKKSVKEMTQEEKDARLKFYSALNRLALRRMRDEFVLEKLAKTHPEVEEALSQNKVVLVPNIELEEFKIIE